MSIAAATPAQVRAAAAKCMAFEKAVREIWSGAQAVPARDTVAAVNTLVDDTIAALTVVKNAA